MTQQLIKKQRHHFADKGPSRQSYDFSSSHVWVWELDHKEEHRKTDAFKLCWRRLLRAPWTARRSNQLILKEILNIHWKDWCWSWSSNTVAIWFTGSSKKTLMLGKIKGRRRRGRQRTRWLDGITDSVDMGFSKFQEIVKDREAWHAAVHRVAKSWTWLSNWTELNWSNIKCQ